jgi:hypothetical protein
MLSEEGQSVCPARTDILAGPPPRTICVTDFRWTSSSLERLFESKQLRFSHRCCVGETYARGANELLGTLCTSFSRAFGTSTPEINVFPNHSTRIMAASAMSGRLTLSDPLVKELAQVSCVHEKHYDSLPKLEGEDNWQEWSDALQHAALIAGTDIVLNGEAKHPKSLEGKQSTTAEWNDNIKRTAIWRSRNESLLKAMRGAADVDFGDFGASNAHDTYVSLRCRYHTSDNQRAFRLYSEDLIIEYDLDESPEEIANDLQNAFNQYNQLVGDTLSSVFPKTS